MFNDNAIQLPTGAYTLNNCSLTPVSQKPAANRLPGMVILENVLPLNWEGQESVLNRSMLERLNELDSTGELTKKLITMYFEFSAHAIHQLCERLGSPGTETVQGDIARHIHSLKSSSGNLGLDRVSAILQQIEQANMTDDVFARAVRLLAIEIARGNAALTEWLNTH